MVLLVAGMCGIAGIIGSNAANYAGCVDQMLAALSHRGPDGSGKYVSPSGSCVLGHKRLAIIDVSENAHQPMVADDGSQAFVYNGECYNFQQLRKELAAGGKQFRSNSDTEVVFHLLSLSNQAGLSQLNGMFALALWDETRRELLLARDQFGQKPLYTTLLPELGLFMFASELRALLATGLVARDTSLQTIANFLSYGAVFGPDTIVDSAKLVPAGHALTISCGALQPHVSPFAHHPGVADGDVAESFADSVERHLISDAKIGIFLSGGIDSTAIVAAARQRSTCPPTTLSVGFPDSPELSELAYAREVASFYRTDHHEVHLSAEELLELLPTALKSMDQPTIDGLNTFAVSRAAHQIGLKVALSGLGSDELFGGYPSFADVPRMRALKNMGLAGKAIADLAFRLNPHNRQLTKLIEALDADNDVASVYCARRRIFSSREVGLMLGLDNTRWRSDVPLALIDTYRERCQNLNTQQAISFLESQAYMQNMLLRDSDCMGMANSVEIRLPFLDGSFAYTIQQLPTDLRLQRGKKYFLSQLKKWLPNDFPNRAKQGFVLPLEKWMSNALSDTITEALEELPELCPHINAKYVSELWQQFRLNPRAIRWVRPWSIFVLATYLRRHNLTVTTMEQKAVSV